MRLHILSDLHLEFEPFTPPHVEVEAVILAGDVSTGRNGLKWALKTFPDRPVIYVLGNHEFYGQKLQKLIKELQELADGTNIHLLENGSCSIGDGFPGSNAMDRLRLERKSGRFRGRGTDQHERLPSDPDVAEIQPIEALGYTAAARGVSAMAGRSGVCS